MTAVVLCELGEIRLVPPTRRPNMPVMSDVIWALGEMHNVPIYRWNPAQHTFTRMQVTIASTGHSHSH